jgi:hypothetical protein
MPITIAGSGTITGISAGGLPDGVITTDDIAANAVTYAKIGTTEQGQLCKAWVNFNGTGTVAIRASYNVSSITDNGTGDYTVNFTSAMVDANYSVIGMGDWATMAWITLNTSLTSPATTSVRLQTRTSASNLADCGFTNVAIFR